ncbi:hypothetical protein [Streptomyces sp. NPDC005438]|uniref:hypothetical protein n=1 Tax=Streptomyces sp. NPDC005438 TaxID=3156880 RepID=UPI0033A50DD4
MSTSVESTVRALLAVPRWEGTFRVRQGDRDLTDSYVELRFKDPRLGGYLDRTRTERDWQDERLTVWLRGPWSWQLAALGRGEPAMEHAQEWDRNVWTLLIPPDTQVTVHSPRRAFAVVRTALGTMSDAQVRVGRTLTLHAGPRGLVAQLDWLSETVEEHLLRGYGLNLSTPVSDWHSAPMEHVVARVTDQLG